MLSVASNYLLCYNKKRIELGYYKNINDAIMARLRAENKYYPNYLFCISRYFFKTMSGVSITLS